jgi:pimeloyl-ACP methyl ester carboxylesterase
LTGVPAEGHVAESTTIHMPEEIRFFQDDGYALVGDVYRRTDGEPEGAVIFCHGFGGARQYIAPDLATGLVERLNCIVLAFDYSGFGDSDGPRKRLDPYRETRDVHSAVSWMIDAHPRLASTVTLFGISFGGAIALAAASRDARVRALVSVSGYSSGSQWMRDLRPHWQWMEFQSAIAADRHARIGSGTSRAVDPDWIMPRDPTSAAFNQKLLAEFPDRKFELDVVSAELIDGFEPLEQATALKGRPSLLVHCEQDLLIPVQHSRRTAAEIAGKLVTLPELGHYDLYAGEAKDELLSLIARWLPEAWIQ